MEKYTRSTSKTKPNLLLLRGAPGSGKTKIAEVSFPKWKHVSTTDYFISNNIYNYNQSKLQESHDYCFSKTSEFLLQGHNVVVHNTFCKLEEIDKYKPLLDLTNEGKIYRVVSQFNNIHAVPNKQIELYYNTYEPHPLETEVKLDLATKKLIICEDKNYKSVFITKELYVKSHTSELITCTGNQFEVDEILKNKLNNRVYRANYPECRIKYYQKPGGINVAVEFELFN